MKIEWIGARRSLSRRVVPAREGTKEEERRNGGRSKRPDDETGKNSTPLPTPEPAFRGGDPTHRARRRAAKILKRRIPAGVRGPRYKFSAILRPGLA